MSETTPDQPAQKPLDAPDETAAARNPLNSLVGWFARNPVAANLMMLLVLVSGLNALANTLRQEVFPEFSSDLITIQVPYLGAAPAEVEDAVCARIEERIQDLEGIKKLTSVAAEGMGVVTVELERGTDVRELLDDIKSRVDAIDTFPDETEEPIIQEVLIRKQVITVAIYGDVGERALRRIGERVRDDLSSLPAISQVELAAVRPYEISIEVSEQDLRRYGLTFEQVVAAVRASSLDLPGGTIRNRDGEILLRTANQAEHGHEFEQMVLLTRPDGTRLLLGDVATVNDGFAETDETSFFDGKPTALVQVFRVGEQSALDIAAAVKSYVERERAALPEGVQLTTWQDDTDVLRGRIDLLLRNGWQGLLLVVLTLALLLRLRLALWVSLGILISFAGALWLMPSLDISINVISLFAFIVVLGIVVDDAIVVGENIYRHLEDGKPGLRAAIDGAREVAVPVTFSILTTIAAFAPLLQVDTNTGKIMRVIPMVVILTLIFSLVESLFILPSHLAHKPKKKSSAASDWQPNAWQRFQDRISDGLKWLVEHSYKPSVEFAMRWRYASLAGAVALLLLTLSLAVGGWIKFTFFPKIEADSVAAYVSMPIGTPAATTQQAVQRMQDQALLLQRQLEAEGHGGAFRHVLASVGGQPFRSGQNRPGGGGSSQAGTQAHLGEVAIELAPAETRTITSPEIAERWRQMVGTIPDATELVYSSSLFSTGEAVNVQLAGSSLDVLRRASEDLKERLREYPGVLDIADSFDPGKQEIQLQVTDEAEAMGIQLVGVARQVRSAFYGAEVQRVQRGREEVKVMVRYPPDERRSIGDLETMRVRTPDGREIPFSTAATYAMGRGYATIQRTDRNRTINVTADVDAATNANEVIADLRDRVLPALLADYPGLRYSFEGEQQQQRDTAEDLKMGFVFALLMIYALLAIPFRSYLQPLIVMTAIPFGLVGAIGGHALLGLDLSMLSMFGIVALTGVVVNDSLVMVDFINRSFRTGTPLLQAVREAGAKRFRPILLTSLTTFMGLLPLLLEKSLQAQFLIPMAVSLAFGVMFATAISLVLVPVCYVILEDLKLQWLKVVGRHDEVPEEGVLGLEVAEG